MAKPRIFVSSTYYDLKHIRTSLESFINSFGYEPVLFESGDIFFSHDKPLDESCYNELKNCHMQVLIIGGSYGSAESSSKLTEEDKKDPYKIFNSVTRKEFEVAHSRKIPIYFFVESGVLSEYSTFKKNRKKTDIEYAHVSSVNIFHLLDEIYSLKSGNFVQGFTKFEDISEWLKLQWAHLLAEFIINRTEQIELLRIDNSVKELSSITTTLKAYTEAFLSNTNPDEFEKVRSQEFEREVSNMMDRFSSHPMIQFISENSTLTTKAIFDKLNAAATFSSFTTLLPKSVRERLLDPTIEPAARDDFKYLKESFRMRN